MGNLLSWESKLINTNQLKQKKGANLGVFRAQFSKMCGSNKKPCIHELHFLPKVSLIVVSDDGLVS